MFRVFLSRSFNISARNRTQDLNNMSSALPLSYWNIDQKRWCSWHVSSTGCKHSSVIDMNQHQKIRLRWHPTSSSLLSYVRLHWILLRFYLNCIFIMNCIFMNQLNSERGQTLTEVENKIDEGRDNQSIHQTINQSI